MLIMVSLPVILVDIYAEMMRKYALDTMQKGLAGD
jgi:hypothetical protein